MNMALAWQLPTLEEMPLLGRFARIGVIPGAHSPTEGMSDESIAALRAGINDARQEIQQRATHLQTNAGGGWLFGTDAIAGWAMTIFCARPFRPTRDIPLLRIMPSMGSP